MKKTFLPILLIIVVVLSLVGIVSMTKKSADVSDSSTIETPIDVSDTLIVNAENTVVLYSPTAEEAQAVMDTLDEDGLKNYLTARDEYDYWVSTKLKALIEQEYADTLTITVVDTNKHHITFRKKDGEVIEEDLDSAITGLGGIFIFDGMKDPIKVESIEEVQNYFKAQVEGN